MNIKNRFIKLTGNFQKTEKDNYKYIKDTTTNLIWQRKTLGPMTWHEAMKLNENGWRVPTLQELESIRDIERIFPCCNPIFEAKIYGHWSSSPYAADSGLAWVVDFSNGNEDVDGKDYGSYVRLVRGGKTK